MGSFYVADFVTGDTIAEGDEVVAFLVRHAIGYPFDKNMSQPSLRPADRWKLESLPIRGKYGDYGRIVPDDKQSVGIQLACFMTGCAQWDELCDKALDGDGVDVRTMSFMPKEPNTVRRHYGLAVMHQSTAEALLTLNQGLPMEEELGAALAVYDLRSKTEALLHSIEASEPPDLDRVGRLQQMVFSLDGVCGLVGDRMYMDEQQAFHEAPSLMHSFESMYGEDFRLALMRSRLTRNRPDDKGIPNQTPAKDRPKLVALLEGAWLAQRLYWGLTAICREISPSIRSGQWHNETALLEFHRKVLAHRFERHVERRIGMDEPSEERARLISMADTFENLASVLRGVVDKAFTPKRRR